MRRRTTSTKTRLVLEHLEDRLCLTTVASGSPVIIPIPGVHAGDTVSVDAVLNTTDPNENGEGEPLIINTSGGPFTISAYAQGRTFTFTAHTDGESISAYIPGFDDDETADVNVSINQRQRYTPQEKADFAATADAYAYWAAFWGGVAAAASKIPPPAGPTIAATAGITASLDAALSVYYNAKARDPSDPNYTVIAQPNPPSLPAITAQPPLTAPEAAAFNALINNLEQQIGLLQASNTSINRANGAADAGDTFWEAAQLQAANQYDAQLAGLAAAEPGLLNSLQSAIQSGGFPKITVTTTDALNFESSVAFSGLPTFMSQPLTQMGLDQPTIANITELMIVQNINQVAGSIPAKITDAGLISALQTLSQALNPLSAAGTSVSPTAGAPFTGVVATFTDSSGSHPASTYGATITWGDGNTSMGTIMPNGSGGFNVVGTNTYGATGPYDISVQITDATSHTVTATSTANVTSLGIGVQSGQTAGIGFWHNKNGQALINNFNGGSNSTALATWLATSFPDLYGVNAGSNNLTGMTNAQVAAFYLALFSEQGPKLDAQVLDTALDVYATTLSLGGAAAQSYGFTVNAYGLGADSYNVGSNGAAFGVADGTTLDVFQILKATDSKAKNGVLYNGDPTLIAEAVAVYGGINGSGGIG